MLYRYKKRNILGYTKIKIISNVDKSNEIKYKDFALFQFYVKNKIGKTEISILRGIVFRYYIKIY